MKKALITIAFSGLLMTACGSGAEKLNEAGNTAFAEQDYAAAVEKYQEAVAADAELAAPLYNTAGVLYRQEVYDQVPAALQVAMVNADETLTQQSHYNLGNSLFKTEDYAGAAEAYREALRYNPQDLDAKVNLELSLKQLQEQQEQEQEEQQNEENQDQQEQNQEQQQESQDQQEGQDQQDQQEQQGEQEQQEQEGSEGQDSQENQDAEQEPGEQDQEGDGQQGEQEQEEPNQEPGDQEQDESQEPEQDDPQEGQDGEDSPDEDQESDPQEPGDSGSEPGDELEEPQQPQPGMGQLAEQLEGLSEEQARQLLLAAAQGTETLQEYLQQIYVFPPESVEQDW